jgi:molybdopterin molybdotransferase
MKTMISVQEARELIRLSVQTIRSQHCSITEANGLVLAEDLFADKDIPAYPQSSMDGYAFAFEEGRSSYHLEGEMAAGSDHQFTLASGKAIRIFTGAAVPPGADTVLMQEKTIVENGILQLPESIVKKGDNVRPIGSEIHNGAKALSKGDSLNPASIGFLAGIGFSTVPVIPAPKVSIIVTGNELQQPGQALAYGQVYDSNSYMLRACLEQQHIKVVEVFTSGDNPEQLSQILEKALAASDLVLMTGGVSVGDYDFTLQAFEDCNIASIFHKIRQKPGKPLLFGMKDKKAVFGLPGNPASVLTCFYEYVLPAIGLMMQGAKQLNAIHVTLAHDHQKPAGLTHFLKAVYDGEYVSLQSGQESYKLSSFAVANCLAVLPETDTHFIKDQLIEIHLLP